MFIQLPLKYGFSKANMYTKSAPKRYLYATQWIKVYEQGINLYNDMYKSIHWKYTFEHGQ